MGLLGEFSLRRFIVEGLVIVASILAAFAIQAWWDNRLENEEEERLLAALLEEGESVLPQIESNVAFHRGMIDRMNVLLAAPLSETPSFPTDSLDALLAASTSSRSADFQTATLSSVLLGGRLAVIDNPDVRERVAAWHGALGEIADVAAQDANRFALELSRYLTTHANRAQLANASQPDGGGFGPSRSAGVPTPTGRQNHFELLHRTEFRNLLLQRRSSQEDILDPSDGYPYLKATLVRLIESLRVAVDAH